MSDCIFCKLATKEIPTRAVYEDEAIFAFHDVNPQAPVHILVIPKKHYTNILDVTESDTELLGRMIQTATRIAADQGFAQNGFRVVLNCNRDGGQSVDHLHFHLLAGRRMTWPPG